MQGSSERSFPLDGVRPRCGVRNIKAFIVGEKLIYEIRAGRSKVFLSQVGDGSMPNISPSDRWLH